MAASTPPVGLDHPTVVPTNFEREDESDEESQTNFEREEESDEESNREAGSSSGDDSEMSSAECR
jgi:hypothetical protein